jgi:hypothetical protein
LYKGERYFSRGTKRLHVAVWEYYNGLVPEGFHIHHKDENTWNNSIDNLECINGSEHLSRHIKEKMQDEEFVKKQREQMDYARIYASKWHGSEEGIEWHREHGRKVAANLQPREFTCLHCGEKFWKKPIGSIKFCSNKCKSAWRRKQGLDNETRICEICGKEFVVSKYSKARTCSAACGGKCSGNTKKAKRSV